MTDKPTRESREGNAYDKAREELDRLEDEGIAFALILPSENRKLSLITNLNDESLVEVLARLHETVSIVRRNSQN